MNRPELTAKFADVLGSKWSIGNSETMYIDGVAAVHFIENFSSWAASSGRYVHLMWIERKAQPRRLHQFSLKPVYQFSVPLSDQPKASIHAK